MPDKDLYAREGELTGDDLARIRDAIVSAYPGEQRDFLYIRMADKWGIRVGDDIVNVDSKPFRPVVQDIAEFAQSEGRLLDLLGLAWSDKPGNLRLNELAGSWLPDQAGVLAKYGEPPPPRPLAEQTVTTAQLQRQIDKHSRLVDLAIFEGNMGRLKRALCRVLIPEVNGTGFLIGRRTVLTNYHVVEKALNRNATSADISCEFDYAAKDAATVKFKARSGEWLGPKSPYSLSDTTGTGEPGPNELDFAVIHLEAEVEPDRLAIELPFAPPIVAQGDYIFIGQHPGGGVAQIALGRVVAHPGKSLRYRYDVTTEPGSSGSPVLDMDMRLVALHHAAEPTNNPTYNQGVPIARIKAALEAGLPDMAAL